MKFETGTALAPPTPERVKWFEKSYRVKLPQEYLEVLQTGNGGVPTKKTFVVDDFERLIERMLCLLPKPKEDEENGWYDLSVVISQLDLRLIDDEELVGINVIPIAALFGGDYVCLDFREDPKSPSVAVWDHEMSEELEPALEPVADSFGEFAALLE